MYLDYFGLREAPFSITPDPRFVFLSERHRDALAHLLYGIGQGGGGGFVQLTGEVGTGKTTLCRLLLEQLPADTRVALVLNPRLSPIELLETICEELKIDLTGRRGSLKGLVDGLNAHLLDAYAQGLRVVLIIDEAQNLSAEALEQVRLLTNLETPTQKLLQIILLGQPELREMLARTDLRQLAQRITARYHLTPLSPDETEAYVRHRLTVAGCQRFPFSRLALRRLHDFAEGVPRLINVIADRSLVAGYAKNLAQIGEREVEQAAQEAMAAPPRRRWAPRTPWLAAAAVGAIAVLLMIWPVPPGESADSEQIDQTEGTVEDASGGTTGDVVNADLSALLSEAGPTRNGAWTGLLALWMVRAEEIDIETAMRCAPQPAPGLFCLRGGGSLSKLETLRRPVLLRMTSVEAREVWALLLGLSRTRARLSIAGNVHEVSRRDLERMWLGEYFALWRAPAFVPVTLRRGDSGPGVEWLRDRLVARGAEIAADAGPAFYGPGIEAAVRSLQSSHGLVPDGIVGPETLLALAADAPGGPRLRRRLG